MYELRAVIEDTRSQRIGGINVGFQIFEAEILSMLLFNSETWEKISSKSMKLLENFCNEFFRKFFRVSSGCPIANLYWQTGFLKAGMMILERKLNFFHHVSNLPEDSLAKETLEIQRENYLEPSFGPNPKLALV